MIRLITVTCIAIFFGLVAMPVYPETSDSKAINGEPNLSDKPRVNTTWEIWQGTTMSCVQCHSHPYDPIRHQEFYQAFAIFNNTADRNLGSEYPVLKSLSEKDSLAGCLTSYADEELLKEFAPVLENGIVLLHLLRRDPLVKQLLR